MVTRTTIELVFYGDGDEAQYRFGFRRWMATHKKSEMTTKLESGLLLRQWMATKRKGSSVEMATKPKLGLDFGD